MAGMIINDSVWGPIELNEVCRLIINTPEFQRLRFIKQLGGGYFVYPGACHNRFEHSIGTSYLAGKLGLELRKNQPGLKITDEDILCLEVAGLCHDLGHGAFSHLFDIKFMKKASPEVKWEHEDASRDMLDRIFGKIKIPLKEDGKPLLDEGDKTFIKDLIKKPKKDYTERRDKLFLYEIVSNDVNKIDVDKWDYFARDCHMLGLHHNFQVERSMKLARVVKHGNGNLHISFPKSEYPNIFDMFCTRYTLHRKAYKHPVTRAIETMIADAFWNADEYLSFPPNEKEKSRRKALSESINDMDAYIWVTDDVFHQIRTLELSGDDAKIEKIKKAQTILDRILTRDLYKLIGEKTVMFVGGKKDVKGLMENVIKWMKKELSNDDVFEIQELILDYGNKDRNPMDDVKFFTRMGMDKKCVPYEYNKDEVSSIMMMPSAFEQRKLQLFWKGSGDEKTDQKRGISKTFSDIKEYSEEGEVLVKFVNTVDTSED